MATALQIVESLLSGFEHQDHPTVQAALNHLIILIEVYYKPGDDATPPERVRYDAVREALNAFRANPLGGLDRLMQELHDIDDNNEEIEAAVQVLMETVEQVTTLNPPSPPQWNRTESGRVSSDEEPSPGATGAPPLPSIEGDDSFRAPPPAVSAPPAPSMPVPSMPAPSAPPPPLRQEPEPEMEERKKSSRGLGGWFGWGKSGAPEDKSEDMPAPSESTPPQSPSAPQAPAPVGAGPEREEDVEKDYNLDWLEDFAGDVDTGVLDSPESSGDLLDSDEPTLVAAPQEPGIDEIKEARRQRFITDTGTFEKIIADDDTAEIPVIKPDGTVTSPPEPEPRSETSEAQFSAYFPGHISRGNSYGLYVYAHTADALQAIQQNVAQFKDRLGGEIPEATTAEARAMLRYGTALTVVPESDNAIFDPPHQTRTWNNDWIRFEFDFVSQVVESAQLDVRVSVQIAGIEIAHINCRMDVSDAGDGPRRSINPLADARLRAVTSRMYQKIFISYSRQDLIIAEHYRLAQQAAGHDVFMDSYSIRAGENWQAALANAIDEADIFQLFWSPNAADSENVRDEWEYALDYRCPDDRCVAFIRPVFWQKPLAPPPPEKLSHLNFKYVPFNGAAAQPAADTSTTSSDQVMSRLDALDARLTAFEETLEHIKQTLRVIYERVR